MRMSITFRLLILLVTVFSYRSLCYAQGSNGYCRTEAGVIASVPEVTLRLPYCRSKAGAYTIQQRETPLYWAPQGRHIQLVPYVANLENSPTLYKSVTAGGSTTTAKVIDAIKRAADTWNQAAASTFYDRQCSDLMLEVLEPALAKPPTNRYTTGKVIEGVDFINTIAWRTGDIDDEWDIDCTLITDKNRKAGCDARGDESTLYAVTQAVYNTSTGEIVDADISFNGESYLWAQVGNATPELLPGSKLSTNCTEVNGVLPEGCIGVLMGVADIQAVVTHELGHLIGFAHVVDSDARSIMNFANSNRRTLTQADIQGLCETYPPAKLTPYSYYPDAASLPMYGGCHVTSASFGGGAGVWMMLGALVLMRRRRGPR